MAQKPDKNENEQKEFRKKSRERRERIQFYGNLVCVSSEAAPPFIEEI
jgi:hypothetical protein